MIFVIFFYKLLILSDFYNLFLKIFITKVSIDEIKMISSFAEIEINAFMTKKMIKTTTQNRY